MLGSWKVSETWWPGPWPLSVWRGGSLATLSLGTGSLAQEQKPPFVQRTEPQFKSVIVYGSEI